MVGQAAAGAEQDRHQAELDLVKQACAPPWSGVRGHDRGYSKRIVEGAVILRSSGSVSVMTPKAATRPMPMIV